MKFEFVEFYPVSKKIPDFNKKVLGTVHIYAIDCQLDIRGIKVIRNGNGDSMYFLFPHFSAIDSDTGEKVKYPFLRWTNNATQQKMLAFLNSVAKAKITERLNRKKTKPKEKKNDVS